MFLQILRRWEPRARNPLESILAPDQACQLYLQGMYYLYLHWIRSRHSLQIRIAYEWTEDYVIKYLWSAAGYCLISIPVLFTRHHSVGVQAGPQAALTEANNAVANRTESAHLLSLSH